MQPLDQADGLLKELGELRDLVRVMEEKAQADMESIRQRYAVFIQPALERFKEQEKELIKLMKRNKKAIFAEEDKIKLEHGILLHGEEDKVIIPRGALEAIEALGWDEAIKVATSLDREVVEGWPDERLERIGATRKPVEKFEYEVVPKSRGKEKYYNEKKAKN